jgi:hypothetical protein
MVRATTCGGCGAEVVIDTGAGVVIPADDSDDTVARIISRRGAPVIEWDCPVCGYPDAQM